MIFLVSVTFMVVEHSPKRQQCLLSKLCILSSAPRDTERQRTYFCQPLLGESVHIPFAWLDVRWDEPNWSSADSAPLHTASLLLSGAWNRRYRNDRRALRLVRAYTPRGTRLAAECCRQSISLDLILEPATHRMSPGPAITTYRSQSAP